MRCFAEANGGLTVVGDPDQSIYGWRSAEVENLNKMVKGNLACSPTSQS
jgi:DNA helicase-2/ATP-dependent DNA helicase PcrA